MYILFYKEYKISLLKKKAMFILAKKKILALGWFGRGLHKKKSI